MQTSLLANLLEFPLNIIDTLAVSEVVSVENDVCPLKRKQNVKLCLIYVFNLLQKRNVYRSYRAAAIARASKSLTAFNS